jgi:hypothetical protein
MNWYTARCPICSGSLHDHLYDKGWVTCLSCGRSFTPHDEPSFGLGHAEFVPVEESQAEVLSKKAA